MLRLRRRPVKTRARLAREELGEGLGHFAQAANHAAGGVGAAVGPRVQAARERVTPAAGKVRAAAMAGLGTTTAAIVPLAAAAREKSRAVRRRDAKAAQRAAEEAARMARKASGRWPKALLLVAGAAVGVAGAVALRRRQRQQWDEYDPGQPMRTDGGARDVLRRASEAASTTTETLAEKTSSAIDAATSDRGGSTRGGATSTGAPTSSLGTTSPIAAPAPGMVTPVPATEPHSSNSRG